MKNITIKQSYLPNDLQPRINFKTQIYELIRDNAGISNHAIVRKIRMNDRSVRRALEELLISEHIIFNNCECYQGCPIRKYQIKK